jgi:hypothetical protein
MHGIDRNQLESQMLDKDAQRESGETASSELSGLEGPAH